MKNVCNKVGLRIAHVAANVFVPCRKIMVDKLFTHLSSGISKDNFRSIKAVTNR